jgi:TRAP-type C4-dicarboxylate transport system permease small subunit
MTATPPPDTRKTSIDPISIFANRLSAWAGASVLALVVLVLVDAGGRRLLGTSISGLAEWTTVLLITSVALPLAAAINVGRLARLDILCDLIGGPTTRAAQFTAGVCAFLGVVAMAILAFAAFAYVSAAIPRAIILAGAVAAGVVYLRMVYRNMMAATAPTHNPSPRR